MAVAVRDDCVRVNLAVDDDLSGMSRWAGERERIMTHEGATDGNEQEARIFLDHPKKAPLCLALLYFV